MFESILCRVTEYGPDVLDSLIELAVEIAREGREGRRVGTLITFGDENAVLARSRPLILDPLSGHPKSSLHVTNLNLRGTIKELAQLDGGFVVSGEGIFLSACRYLDAVAAQVDVPLGLGSRHIAAANMSAITKAARLRHSRPVQHRARGRHTVMGTGEAGYPHSARCARADGRRVASSTPASRSTRPWSRI